MDDALPPTISYGPIRLSLVIRALLGFGLVVVVAWAGYLGWTSGRADPISILVLAAGGVYFAYIATGYLSQVGDKRSLTLDLHGFSYRFAWRIQKISWLNVSEFKVVLHRTVEGIAFDIPSAPVTWARRLNRDAVGASEFMMPHTFDAPIHEVCKTLNAFRTRALASS